ncbi:uncharacterized protein J4E92_009150 [Alternaria infectoria]|uniref:uncharacterized protein n=1 Tax=Alternaria infectoria TaxID=45303 RepID=UPI00221F8CEF|nr:uncharacterized protein J4E92_009150 [Alternaria infectoria]KAI4916646.1 hypothetical protein J4E92_009150 [Alternaria infectoria]
MALEPSGATLATLTPKPDLNVDCPFPPPSPDINITEAIALDDLANLPPLPSLTHDEIQDLDPNYPNNRATIHYYTLSPSGTLTQETHPTPVSRTSVLLSLEYFYTLRKHLTANLAILDTYSGTSLAGIHDTETTPSNVPWEDTVTDVPNPNAHTQSDSRRDSSFEPEVQKTATRKSPFFTELERVQNEFAMHHIAINENLRAVNSNWGCHAFGLPDPLGAASDIRRDRNYFAHTFPTPTGKGIQLEWAVKGKREGYGGLLGLVEGGICGLQEQLDDTEIWVSPQVIERERLEKEVREQEERLVVEGEEQDDDGDCVLEQEDDVEGMAPPGSLFSRVFDSFGGNVVLSRCFRFGVVRRAGQMLFDWLGEMLAEANAFALRRAGKGAAEKCGEGDEWGSQEDEIGDYDCGSQEYKIEDEEGYGSQDMDAHLERPDSGWGDPQW